MRESKIKQPVVDMGSIGFKRRLFMYDSDTHYPQRIKKRDKQNSKGYYGCIIYMPERSLLDIAFVEHDNKQRHDIAPTTMNLYHP